MEWWVFPALVLCAVTFLAAAGVLVFLAARGVWRLLARYEPAHALTPAGERWVPWEDDPRVGSMQLADDVAVGGWEYRSTSGVSYPPPLPPLDWREVAHEGDWRAQTRHDLAPAVLAQGGDAVDSRRSQAGPIEEGTVLSSGPGGPSLAPGPDLPTLASPADLADLFRVVAFDPERGFYDQDARRWENEPPPEPVHTVAGRLVETSDEWLRRLVADAAPGWTYAGTVAA